MRDRQDIILVTGASGFVGRSLVGSLDAAGRRYVALGRESGQASASTDWGATLRGVSSVIHLAGRHVGDAEVFERDIAMTLNFARQAADRGIERFVFLSSIKVNGENTPPGHVFTESDTPAPLDTYGRAKLRIEEGLRELSMPLTIVRPPLVYGPGVRGNFRRLINAVRSGWPLPLAAIENRRSIVAVENLCDFLIRVADEPRAVGETYLVADGEDLSTTELLRRLARALDRPSRLYPVAPGLIERSLRFAGLGGWADRLIGDLRVDSNKARGLGWAPPLNFEEQLARMSRRPGEL